MRPEPKLARRTNDVLLELRGPWLHNKGDRLMVEAIVAALSGADGQDYALAAADALGLGRLPPELPIRRLRYESVGESRIGVRKSFRKRFVDAATLRLLPAPALDAMGVRPAGELAGLLDCSGFAYGDQWNAARVNRRAAYYALLKRRGLPLIMLPQALGPFERDETRTAARALFANFDLIYARDRASRDHALPLLEDKSRLRLVPDITHLFEPPPPSSDWSRRACVVPNQRMMDRTAPEVGERYMNFLLAALATFREIGLEPFLMLHETNDAALAAEIAGRAAFPLETIDPAAVEAKSVLGACAVVLSSRYHALVGALSQGVPAVGTTWAHKYDALFEEYDCSDMLLSPLDREETLRARIAQATEPAARDALRAKLRAAAARQKAKVAQMWEEIRATLATAARG